MKKLHLLSVSVLLALAPGIMLTACAPVIPPAYHLVLPALPAAWEEMLGPPRWRVEWFGADGRPLRAEGDAGALPAITIPPERANAVLAYPFWPDRGIQPGNMRPAGAIFPLDAGSSGITLSWKGGVEASFFRALNAAAGEAASAGEVSGKNLFRRGEYFDWPRFRALLDSAGIPAPIREDPWLADWRSVAARTVHSGFDRRRILAEKREALSLPIPAAGPWIGASPFAGPLSWKAGETALAGVTAAVDTYVSPQGILHCTRGAWSWLPY